MITKKYESDMDVRLSVNGNEVRFEQGYWHNGYRQPAHLTTSDKDIQNAVEHNALYGNRIHCIEVIDDGADDKKVVVEEKKEETTTKVYEDVTDIKQAMEILTAAPYNLKVVQCNILGKVRTAEKKFNISFPNL